METESQPPASSLVVAPRWWDVRLRRNRSRRVMAGVIGGISDAYGFGVGIARIVTGVGAVVSGVVVIPLYLALWIVLPVEPSEGLTPRAIVSSWRRHWAALVLVVIAASAVFHNGLWAPPGEPGNLVWAALLTVAAVWLWKEHGPGSSPTSTPPAAGPGPSYAAPGPYAAAVGDVTAVGDAIAAADVEADADFATDAGAVGETGTEHDPDATPLWRPDPATWWPPPPPASTDAWSPVATERRPRGPRLGRRILAAGLVALGLAVAGDLLGWYRLSPSEGFAVVLGVLGAAVVVSAFVGGGRGLAVLAVLGCVGLLSARWFERSVSLPRSTLVGAEAAAGAERGFGHIVVDLASANAVVRGPVPISLGAGVVEVVVPANAAVVVRAEVGVGEMDVLGRHADGIDVDNTWRFDVPGETASGADTIVVDIEVGVGRIRVERSAGPR